MKLYLYLTDVDVDADVNANRNADMDVDADLIMANGANQFATKGGRSQQKVCRRKTITQ